MDYATLTDSNGRKSDFRNVILIMTTNTGARESLQNAIGFGSELHADRSLKAVEKAFSPEFRNRLSAIIQFNSLSLGTSRIHSRAYGRENCLSVYRKNVFIWNLVQLPEHIWLKKASTAVMGRGLSNAL